jgi:hypothetical protein
MNQLNHRGAKEYPGGSLESEWPQLATYPQSPFSGPTCCCDVAYLSQAFSQPTGPGRLWISLSANSLSDTSSKMIESKHELKQ